MTEHSRAENHTILELLGGDATPFRRFAVVARVLARFWIAAEVGMALRSKPVERSTHIEFFLRLHVKERQVEG